MAGLVVINPSNIQNHRIYSMWKVRKRARSEFQPFSPHAHPSDKSTARMSLMKRFFCFFVANLLKSINLKNTRH